jgi:hypothetical protein
LIDQFGSCIVCDNLINNLDLLRALLRKKHNLSLKYMMTAPVNLNEWTSRLMHNEDIFPFEIDFLKDQVLLVKLSSPDRNTASFLDQRVLTPTTPGGWVPWQAIQSNVSAGQDTGTTHYMFHVGHCGSTLLSRLLAHSGTLQSVREPLILRSFAQEKADWPLGCSFLTRDEQKRRLQTMTALWGRGASRTLIKATSICTDLMPCHLSDQAEARAIFIFNGLETHLAAMLASDNHQVDLKNFARMRVQRLRHMTSLNIRLDQLGTGQLVAMSWLCEAVSACLTRQTHKAQVGLVDFDGFLAKPQETLIDLHAFLGAPVTPAAVEQAVNSSIMRTYSKAPEYEYSPQARAHLLADSRTKNQQIINQGLNWIDQQAKESQLVTEALTLFR